MSIIFVASKNSAFSATISAPTTAPQSYSANSQTLSLNSGADLSVDTNASGVAAVSSSYTSSTLTVSSGNAANGIKATGNYAAVQSSGSGYFSSLRLNSGIITSNNAAGATISLERSTPGLANHIISTNIQIAAGTTVSNTAADGYAIMRVNSYPSVVGSVGRFTAFETLTNAGTITANQALYYDGGPYGSRLTLNNTGTINGDLTSVSGSLLINNSGNGVINGDVSLASDLTNTVNFNISGNAVVNGNINLSYDNRLNISGGSVLGDITGSDAYINIQNSYNLVGDVDITGSGARINITGNKTLTVSDAHVNIAKIYLRSGSIINFNSNSSFSGSIENLDNVNATVNFNADNEIQSSSSIASNLNEFGKINIANGANVVNRGYIGGGSATVIGGGVSGVFEAASGGYTSSKFKISNGGKLIYSGGILRGTVSGFSSGSGTFEINSDYNESLSPLTFSSSSPIGTIQVNSGKTYTVNSDISALNTSVYGALNLGDVARTINGNLRNNSGGTINMGSASLAVSGNVSLAAGSILDFKISNLESAGAIVATGLANVDSNVRLNVAFDPAIQVTQNTSYIVVSGADGSSISDLSQGNININNSNSNRFGSYVFVAVRSEDNLVLKIIPDSVIGDKNADNVFNVVKSPNVSGALRNFQNYVDRADGVTKENALKSATPQVDNGINRSIVNVANASVRTAESRLEMGHLDNIGLSSGDSEEGYGIWARGFGSSVKQGVVGNYDGYNASSSGFALGVDKEVNHSSLLGVNFSYADTNVKSTSKTKTTSVKTYQANIYGGRHFDKFFIDGIAGFAWNEYSSNRFIEGVGLNANANYGGQTYVIKLKVGTTKKIGKGFLITPEIALTGAHSSIEKYRESGADSMNLVVNSNQYNFLEARVGTNLRYNFIRKNGEKITPEFKISYGHDFIGDRQFTTNRFVDQSNTFISQGAKVERNSLIIGLGLNLYKLNAVTISTDYLLEHKERYDSHTGSLKVRYDF